MYLHFIVYCITFCKNIIRVTSVKLILRLFVRVDNLDGLAPKGKDKRPYKTVLKLTLLPQEKTTKTSKTIAAAMSPVVNEDFFISTKCITNKVLR